MTAPSQRSEPSPGLPALENWCTPGRFAFFVGLLFIALYPDVIVGARSFVLRDFGYFGYPIAQYHRDSFWRGEIPLWNPLNNCGLPFLAQWNTMTLYPLSLIYLIFPLSWSLGVFCLVHLFLATMGMYQLARTWTGSSFAGVVAGIIFGFNGLGQHCLMWPNNVAALGWMPWMVLACEGAVFSGGRAVIPAVLVGTLQMLSGAPEFIAFTWLMVLTFVGGRIFVEKHALLPVGLRLTSIIAGIVGLSAAQLLPFLQLLSLSQRSSSYGGTVWSMPPWGWANFLVPVYGSYQNEMGGKPAGPFFQYGQYWTSSYYLGLATLVLIAVAVLHVRRWRVWSLFAVFLFSVITALGEAGPIYPIFRKLFPQLGFLRFPIKFVVLAVFCAPLLSAYAMTALLTVDCHGSKRVMRFWWTVSGVLGILTAGVVWFTYRFPFDERTVSTVSANAFWRLTALAMVTVLLAALMRRSSPLRLRILGGALAAVLWIDFATHTARQNPTVPRGVFQPELANQALAMHPKPTHGIARAMLTPSAITTFKYRFTQNLRDDYLRGRLGFFSNCNLLDRLSKIDGFYSLYIREADEVISGLYKKPADPLMDFLGVAQVTAPESYFEWTNRSSYMSFISAGQKVRHLSEAEILAAVLSPSFEPRQTVYLPTPKDSRALSPAPIESMPLEAEVRQVDAHFVELTTTSLGAQLLVISQAFYPCWRGFIDFKTAPIVRANHAFQALSIPVGVHHIRIEYYDRAFFCGMVISLLSAIAVFVAYIKKRPGFKPRPL